MYSTFIHIHHTSMYYVCIGLFVKELTFKFVVHGSALV